MKDKQKTISSDGIVRYGKSKDNNCVCCIGSHIYAKGIEFEGHTDHLGEPGDANDLVQIFLQRNKYSAEGRRVRVIVEFIK